MTAPRSTGSPANEPASKRGPHAGELAIVVFLTLLLALLGWQRLDELSEEEDAKPTQITGSAAMTEEDTAGGEAEPPADPATAISPSSESDEL